MNASQTVIYLQAFSFPVVNAVAMVLISRHTPALFRMYVLLITMLLKVTRSPAPVFTHNVC